MYTLVVFVSSVDEDGVIDEMCHEEHFDTREEAEEAYHEVMRQEEDYPEDRSLSCWIIKPE